MTLKEHDFAQITERLVTDFQGLVPLETIASVLRSNVEKSPDQAPELIEQATRIQLQIRRQGQLR